MKRKIMAILLSVVLCASVCSCGNIGKPAEPTPPPIVEVVPSTILTVNDASSETGDKLVQENGIKEENGASYVLYRSEPIGKSDTVKVSIEQYSNEISKESIKQKFDADRSKRTSAVDVEGIEDCFIAFPTVYYYKDGYYIKITAGSGDTDEQKQLLESLIRIAAKNLDGFIAQ